jgi:hypothetical protein
MVAAHDKLSPVRFSAVPLTVPDGVNDAPDAPSS